MYSCTLALSRYSEQNIRYRIAPVFQQGKRYFERYQAEDVVIIIYSDAWNPSLHLGYFKHLWRRGGDRKLISDEINQRHGFKFNYESHAVTLTRQKQRYWYKIVLIILSYFCWHYFAYKSVTANMRQMLEIGEHFWKSSMNRKIIATVLPWSTLPVRCSCLLPRINVRFYAQVNM